ARAAEESQRPQNPPPGLRRLVFSFLLAVLPVSSKPASMPNESVPALLFTSPRSWSTSPLRSVLPSCRFNLFFFSPVWLLEEMWDKGERDLALLILEYFVYCFIH